MSLTRILTEAEFTKDMVETMLEYFDQYAVDGVLRVEVTNRGLWLPNPIVPGRQFLGLARLPDELRH
ncbi:hypothetical protein FNJ84_19810 [Paracoccus sp. M683]|uniref:Uncharacterized protein n=1 Tax=Paracoccus zhejiangensis TaxID=1077935 RepID=A0A2H5F5K8_9RHOB|nr:hypothetical protein [Paracoccus sp. M683]AUH66814.1 hypothetical protein CX676_21185 [Paracoccus zhejiangensis]TRW94286.1 hypothetical protein FNJ84_19810 [Paracoccus sp. M683]